MDGFRTNHRAGIAGIKATRKEGDGSTYWSLLENPAVSSNPRLKKWRRAAELIVMLSNVIPLETQERESLVDLETSIASTKLSTFGITSCVASTGLIYRLNGWNSEAVR